MNNYMIVEAEGYDRLEREVNKLMAKGWQPLGGITSPAKTASRSRHRRVAQALTKPKDSEVVEPDKEPETEEESDDSVLNGSVADLKEYVQGVDDVDTLSELLSDEKSGKDRKTAKESIEDRIAELTDISEPEEEPDNSGAETTEDGYVKSD